MVHLVLVVVFISIVIIPFHFAVVTSCRTLFASATLNLCDLLALREDLRQLRKVLYFHENQLIYPVRKHLDRDFQFGYNQIISWCVAVSLIQPSAH